jgi:hypothetical protein
MIPLIIGASGSMSKSFRKCMNNIPGKHDVKELHGHYTLTAGSTNVKVQNVYHRK